MSKLKFWFENEEAFFAYHEALDEAEPLRPARDGDAGIDLVVCDVRWTKACASCDESDPALIDGKVFIGTGYYVSVDLGVRVAIPDGYVGLLVERSSCQKRHLSLANSVGVIDSGYRGTLFACLHADSPTEIGIGDRLLQLVVVPIFDYSSIEVSDLFASEEDPGVFSTARGTGGFGSTG